MNLSRAAKKFRTSESNPSPRPIKSKKPEKLPDPIIEKAEPVVEQVVPVIERVEPVVEQVVVAPPPPKIWPVKQKRLRFVREQVEKRERVNLPPLPSSRKFFARLMTQNLAVPPKDEAVKLGR